MKINVLLNKYQGKTIEDAGCYMSSSAKKFASSIRATIKEIALNNGAELVDFSIGHYDISGFIKKNEKHIYFSRNIERYERTINLNATGPMEGFLIRTAKGIKDYTGGTNHFTNLSGFEHQMNSFFD